MLLRGKNLVYLNNQTRKGKNGNFTIVTLGCPETFTRIDVFVPEAKLKKLESYNPGEIVDVELDISQQGFNKSITLVDLNYVSEEVVN